MPREIERKFLVRGHQWRRGDGLECRQGYLCATSERTVRVRTMGSEATLTIKGETVGSARPEYEYSIPMRDAEEMLEHLCGRPLIEKRRHHVDHAGLTWDIDEFLGENEGLVIAEVELAHEEQPVPLPPWAGDEVTADPRYFNANLARHPFRAW